MYLLFDDIQNLIFVFDFPLFVLLDIWLLNQLVLFREWLDDGVLVDEIGVVVIVILAFGTGSLLFALLAG